MHLNHRQFDWDTTANHEPKNMDELIAKYRPKLIRTYDEDGKLVKVYEARYG